MSGDTGASPPRVPVRGARAAGGRTGTVRGAESRSSAHNPRPSHAPWAAPPSWPNGPALASSWPLRDFIELGGLPGVVPCARHHSRQVLWKWQLPGLAEDAELLVSELVTNAVTASSCSASPVRLWLLSDTARVLILVQDDSPHPPVRTQPEADAACGRGLLLVDALSSRWDWYVLQHGGVGKVTWALLECGPPGTHWPDPAR
jgi:hypothetical protein